MSITRSRKRNRRRNLSRMISRSKRARLWLPALVFVACLHIGAACDAAERGVPAQHGILNFGKISDGLFRGAQPDAAAISNLQNLGIKTIIDLRMPKQVSKTEESQARAHGILYTNFPMHGLGRPADEQVRQVLSLIQTLPGPVFVHCQHGCDRTGTIIACYRIERDHWTRDAAFAEARQYGISQLERGMKSFVMDFGKTSDTLAKN